MLKIILCKGAPASGKSFWAKQEVSRDPSNYLRINNDDLRASFNNSNWSGDYEKLIKETRTFLIKEGLKRNLNIIIDNVNAGKRHWEDTLKLAKESNRDVMVMEKLFFEDLETLLERNSKREGVAKVPDEVVKKWFKELGGKQFKSYSPRVEIFKKRDSAADRLVEPMKFSDAAPKAIIVDLDGTLALIGNRSPYDASNCDIVDSPNPSVVKTVKLFYDDNYKILFCSGRMEKDRAPTERFIEACLGHKDWKLFMRKTDDQRKDSIVKGEIFDNELKDNYNIHLVIDDRLSVCQYWFSRGLNLFRVGDPDANF